MVKIATILGARPQFIKAAPVSKLIRENTGTVEFMIHTGQHYDQNMSDIFYQEMEIPEPDVNIGVGSGSHGRQTGEMLIQIEDILIKEKPDKVLVYGDTNSTLAGALAACKLCIPIAHVESGLRSFNREMPEEHNRVVADHCANILFCPTKTAVHNLAREGISQEVHLVGDTMLDAVQQFTKIGEKQSTILKTLGINPKEYILVTVHRPYNTDNQNNFLSILSVFQQLDMQVIFPVHPRSRKKMIEFGGDQLIKHQKNNLKIIDPVGYLDMLVLEKYAHMIMTDSGGVQKEAYFFEVPCITLRHETEWVETVDSGWNILAGANSDKILQAATITEWPTGTENHFGDGKAAEKIVALMS